MLVLNAQKTVAEWLVMPAALLGAGVPILRPADWQSGKDQPDGTIRTVEHIAPFGGRDEMVQEFAGAVR